MKVVLDTDIGGDFDDANALALVLASPELELVAVTTVGAGADARRRAAVARHLLTAAGRTDVPVHAGADDPLVPNPTLAALDPEHCLNAWDPAMGAGDDVPVDAAAALVELARRHGRDLTVISIGAMTNLATAIRQDPEVMGRLGGVVAMSGAFHVQLREANVAIDPEAADAVYRSGIPLRLVGYEEASRAVLPLSAYRAGSSSPVVDALATMARRYGVVYGQQEVRLYDVTAVAAVLRPSWFGVREQAVAVELAGRFTRGMTVVDADPYFNSVPTASRVELVVDARPDRIVELFRARVLDPSVTPASGAPATSGDPAGPDIAVVGSANVDLVLDVDHRPAPGETLLGADVVTTPGGKGANQAVAAARAGGRVAFVGCVGADGNGALLRDSLRAAGVDVTALRTVDAPTGTAVIVVTPDGENSIIVSPGANRSVQPGMLAGVARDWAAARILVAQLEIPAETVAELARHAVATGARLVLNAAPVADLPDEVLAACDPLVVNESESRALLGGRRPEPAEAGATAPSWEDADGEGLAHALLERGPRSVVVTLGPGGAVVADASGTTRVDAPRVRAVDTTGAGDAFVGALAAGLSGGQSLADAARVAASYAAATVTRRGAQASYGSLDEVAGALAGA